MTMGKFASNLFLAALAIGLSIFTASRTLDLLSWALPAGQTIYQWLGLAAFEGGMYFWAFFFISGAKGTPQRTISLIMAVFSVLAVCIATVTDLSLGASESGKIAPLSPSMQQAMIIFVGVVIALNVAAFLACHLMAPEKMREIKSGVAEDLIYAEGLRAIEALAPTMAAEAAPYLAAEWSNRTWQRIVPGVQRRTEYLGPAPAAAPALPAPTQQPPVFSAPAPAQPAPVPAEKKPGIVSRAKGFLGLGGDGRTAPATLAQTATVPAPAHVAASYQRVRAQAVRPDVAAMRRARRAARFHQPQAVPVPAAPAGPAPDEHRTCSECGRVLDLKNAKQLTCSPACRAKRARRLAEERKTRKH